MHHGRTCCCHTSCTGTDRLPQGKTWCRSDVLPVTWLLRWQLTDVLPDRRTDTQPLRPADWPDRRMSLFHQRIAIPILAEQPADHWHHRRQRRHLLPGRAGGSLLHHRITAVERRRTTGTSAVFHSNWYFQSPEKAARLGVARRQWLCPCQALQRRCAAFSGLPSGPPAPGPPPCFCGVGLNPITFPPPPAPDPPPPCPK